MPKSELDRTKERLAACGWHYSFHEPSRTKKGAWLVQASKHEGLRLMATVTFFKEASEVAALRGIVRRVEMIEHGEKLVEALRELVGLVDSIVEGNYTPDSFTTQPAKAALALVPEKEADHANDES